MERSSAPVRRRTLLAVVAGVASAGAARAGSRSGERPGDGTAPGTTTTGDGAPDGTATPGDGPTGTATTGATRTVEMTDSLNFAPASIAVSPGTTVVWENVGTVPHTVTAYGDGIPDDAAYFASGGYDSEPAARDAYGTGGGGAIAGGETYEHTFEVTGTHEYLCIPHESGMTGTVEVSEDAGRMTERDPQELGVPFRPHYVGLATLAGVVCTLVYAFFVLKYGESGHASSPERR